MCGRCVVVFSGKKKNLLPIVGPNLSDLVEITRHEPTGYNERHVMYDNYMYNCIPLKLFSLLSLSLPLSSFRCVFFLFFFSLRLFVNLPWHTAVNSPNFRTARNARASWFSQK